MAATKKKLTKSQQDNVRAAIQTTQLVKRLQCFALEEKDAAGHDVEIDAGRLRAIEVLLRKSLPDLQAIQVTGKDEGPIETKEVGQGAAKLAAFLGTIAERSGNTGEPSPE